jgi:transcriptional regulator with PAS, ATPase and Fis domain
MHSEPWFKHFPGAITVTDENAIIINMNDAAAEAFEDDGGYDLIGQSVVDCHPPDVQAVVRELYESREPNVYTIQTHGKKKLIYQTPYFEDGILAGVVELNLPLPEEMPHFDRDEE